jgi:spore coat polysaccharide biosynthesis protein SpsF (cytidylyltransferase family)
MNYLVIIQARLGSSRLPGKVMQTVGGVPMVKRVFNAAKASMADKVIVAWPERYPDLDENNVLERFKRIAQEFNPVNIIRLTADCPLLTSNDINEAIRHYHMNKLGYYNNGKDGYDVQIFKTHALYNSKFTHSEHVIKDAPNVGGLSVNTKEELERVRAYAR